MVHGHGPRSHCKGHNRVIFPRAWPHHLRRLEQARPSGPKGKRRKPDRRGVLKDCKDTGAVQCYGHSGNATVCSVAGHVMSRHALSCHVTIFQNKMWPRPNGTRHGTVSDQILSIVFVTVTVRISISKFIT